MKGILKSIKLWRILFGVFAVLLAILICATQLAFDRVAVINRVMGTRNTKVITADGEEIDTTYYKSAYKSTAELVDAREKLMVQISEEGSVLLKNNGALPLKENSKVTLLGIRSSTPVYAGEWGCSIPPDDKYVAGSSGQYLSFVDAMKNVFDVNPTMISFYSRMQKLGYNAHGPRSQTNVISTGEVPKDEFGKSQRDSYATYNAAAIVVIGRQNREDEDFLPGTEFVADANDTALDNGSLSLSQNERDTIAEAKQYFEKVIVCINSDSQIEIDELKNDAQIDAILWIGAPGVTFQGVANVLCGKANPSGHLSVTYAVNTLNSPAMQNFGRYYFNDFTATGTNGFYIVQNEGIYVGYKYYETRYADCVNGVGNADSAFGATDGLKWEYGKEISYGFGYGLSYSEFDQEIVENSFKVDLTTGKGEIQVKVTNKTEISGKDAVQVYVQTPYTDYDKQYNVEKSAVQLLGIAKSKILKKGESQTLTVEFDALDLASYDYTEQKGYILDEGNYFFAIGNGAHDALNNILTYQGKSESNGMDYTGDGDKVRVWTNAAFDNQTFKNSKTGAEVTNQFDKANLNNLGTGTTVEYFTRKDWTKGWNTYGQLKEHTNGGYYGSGGTTSGSKVLDNIKPTESMKTELNNKTISSTTGNDDTSDIVWGSSNTSYKLVELIGKDYNDPIWDELLSQITLAEACNFIQAAANDWEAISSIELAVGINADGPIGIAGDQRGGYAGTWSDDESFKEYYVPESDEYANYCCNTFPTPPVVASTFNLELVEAEGKIFGNDSLWHNVPIIFAPGVNIIRSPYNGRNHSYYSEDGVLTALVSSNFCNGAREYGAQIVVKHFAFNEQESGRGGIATFMNEQEAREIMLRAFRTMCEGNTSSGLMTSYTRIGCRWAGASSELQLNVLRKEWGYQGLLVTDMVSAGTYAYMNWWDNIANGGGLLLAESSTYAASRFGSLEPSKVSGNRAMQSAMKEIMHQSLYQIVNSNQMNNLSINTTIVEYLNWWQVTVITLDVVFAALALGGAAMYVCSVVINAKRR